MSNLLIKSSLNIYVAGFGCCKQEIIASAGPIYDISRFGISFVSYPENADVLIVQGSDSLCDSGYCPFVKCDRKNIDYQGRDDQDLKEYGLKLGFHKAGEVMHAITEYTEKNLDLPTPSHLRDFKKIGVFARGS